MLKTFSQAGQELLISLYLKKLFGLSERYEGTYIDIGAYHPTEISNTYFFYRYGWSGLCIDPNGETEALFLEQRPRDIFARNAVAERDGGEISYWKFRTAAHNTCDRAVAESYLRRRPDALVSEEKIAIRSLSSLIDQYIDPQRTIDFLSIDTEGFEEKVILGMDFGRHRPSLLMMESIVDPASFIQSELHQMLVKRRYKLIAHTGHDAIFADLLRIRRSKTS